MVPGHKLLQDIVYNTVPVMLPGHNLLQADRQDMHILFIFIYAKLLCFYSIFGIGLYILTSIKHKSHKHIVHYCSVPLATFS